ncbi:MAG: hypothetical protein K9J17_07875 [Flavobacteriales bacterium]|nr:hypothetical protein [Flavobacteriales bacterium]
MLTILISTFQVSVVGFQTGDNSWFDFLTTVMAEEETEDAQSEEDSFEAMDWLLSDHSFVELASVFSSETYRFHNPYISFVGEVSSPPPEA